MRVKLALVAWLIFNFVASGKLLNRNTEVYHGLISEIQRYFINSNIVLFYPMENLGTDIVNFQGLLEIQKIIQSLFIPLGFQDEIFVWRLQNYLSKSNTFTAVMDFRSFNKTNAFQFHDVVSPLFVLLNGNAIMQEHLVWVSQWMIMSTYSTWLLFIEEETSIEDYLKDVYVSIDSTFLISKPSKNSPTEEVKCAYHIERTDLRVKKFASWTRESGLTDFTKILTEKTKYYRGKILRISSREILPATPILRDKNDEMIGLMGYYGELMKTLLHVLNIRASYQESLRYGGKENGSFTGALGLVERNEVDLLLAMELAITPDRSEVAHSLTPLYEAKYLLIIRKPTDTNIKWTAYLAPFTLTTWISILLLIFIGSSSISFTNWTYTQYKLTNNSDNASSDSFVDISLEIFGSLCSQGIQSSNMSALRSIHFVTHITAIIVLAAYSAALISFLTTQPLALPFSTMEGLAQDKTYKMGIIEGSADHLLLKKSTNKVLRKLYDNYLTPDNPRDISTGLNKVCIDNKFAFMMMEHWAQLIEHNVSCTFQLLDVAWIRYAALQTTRSNPFREALSQVLCKLRTSGILQRMYRHELLHDYMPENKEIVSYKPVDMNDILPLLLFFFGGFTLSCFILLIEYSLFMRWNGTKMNYIRE